MHGLQLHLSESVQKGRKGRYEKDKLVTIGGSNCKGKGDDGPQECSVASGTLRSSSSLLSTHHPRRHRRDVLMPLGSFIRTGLRFSRLASFLMVLALCRVLSASICITSTSLLFLHLHNEHNTKPMH